MKKRAALLVALSLAVVTVLAGCGGKDSSKSADSKDSATTFEEKKEGDTFTVGFDQDFPPMGFVGDDGEYTGFDLELAKEVCDRNGWEFHPEPIAWDSKDALLKSGEIDCIWNGFTMNGREDEYTWSEPYLDNQQVFVVRADSGINSEKDLAGKTVDVQTDSSAEAALKDNTELSSTFSTEIDLTSPFFPFRLYSALWDFPRFSIQNYARNSSLGTIVTHTSFRNPPFVGYLTDTDIFHTITPPIALSEIL